MKLLEDKLTEARKFENPSNHPDELMGETESEDESVHGNGKSTSELDARLSRLALLDKTQHEINQLSVATENLLQQSE